MFVPPYYSYIAGVLSLRLSASVFQTSLSSLSLRPWRALEMLSVLYSIQHVLELFALTFSVTSLFVHIIIMFNVGFLIYFLLIILNK